VMVRETSDLRQVGDADHLVGGGPRPRRRCRPPRRPLRRRPACVEPRSGVRPGTFSAPGRCARSRPPTPLFPAAGAPRRYSSSLIARTRTPAPHTAAGRKRPRPAG
jgi:hypothetical protein